MRFYADDLAFYAVLSDVNGPEILPLAQGEL